MTETSGLLYLRLLYLLTQEQKELVYQDKQDRFKVAMLTGSLDSDAGVTSQLQFSGFITTLTLHATATCHNHWNQGQAEGAGWI